MKKQLTKKIIAILCAITLLPLGYFAGITSNAAEEIATSTTMKEYTIRDLFMPDKWYDSDYTSTTEGNMVNTSFTTYISFPNDGNTNLWLGNELNGFVFQGQSGGVNMMHYTNGGNTSEFFALMTSDIAGVELLNNPNLKMKVTVEQSGETGIKVGVYFNDVLYGGSFFEKEGITAEMLPKSISIRRYNGTTQNIYLKSPTESTDSVPTDLRNITLSNAGIANGSNSEFAGDLGVESLDGTLFSVKLQYNANYSRFHFGVKDNSTNMFTGISFRLDGDTLKVSNEVGTDGIVNLPFDYITLDAATAGIGTTFNNTEFLLQISTEYVDHDNGGVENDIKFGVFINGKLYDNQYFYIKDGVEQLGTQINFNEGVAISYESYVPEIKVELEEWTIRDLFMPDRWYDSDYTSTTEGDMVNTSFTTYVSFPNDGNTNLWLGNELNGFVLQGQSGGVNMMHYTNGGNTSEFFALMTSDIAGVELLNNPNLKMTVTVEQSGETGIKVGVYFNDVLYGGSFFEKKGITAAMLPKSISIRRYNGTTQKVYLKSPTESTDSVPTDLQNITLSNAGIDDGTNSMFSGDLGVSSLDGTLFSARLRYNVNYSRFHFGVKENSTNMFTGISFRLDGDTLKISNEVGTNGIVNLPFDYITLDAAIAGIGTTFNNTEFLLQISTEYVDHDNGGTENDIKFGVFINGKLYDNQYFYVKDGAEQLGTQINFNEGNAVSYKSCVAYNSTGLNEWTIRNLYMPDRWFDASFASVQEGDLLGTAFTTIVNFANDGQTNFWLGSSLNGFIFQGKSDGVNMMHYTNGGNTSEFFALMTSDIAGVELLNNPNLKMTVTVEQSGETGIKVGVYFNDILYGGSFFEKEGITATMLPKCITVDRYSATQNLYLASPAETTDSTEVPTDMENLTLLDGNILDGANSGFGGSLGVNTLNDTLFSVRLKYNGEGSRFHYGVKDNADNAFTGISFRLSGDGLAISNEVGVNGLSNMAFSFITLDAETAGIGTTFVDTEFLLQISTEFVDFAGDGNVDDVKFGVFINGKLYDNQYFYIKDGATQLGTQFNFNEGTAALYKSHFNEGDLETRVVPCSETTYATYRSANGNVAPTAGNGYLFAGWFCDSDCKQVLSTETTENTAYAKFVDADVLIVKAQITAGTTANSDSADIRFVTTVDSLDYQEVGFDITIEGREKVNRPSNTVYETLYVVGSDSMPDSVTPQTEFCPASNYFNTYAYWNVPKENFDTEFTVEPYWITLDGTIVYGETATKTVSDGYMDVSGFSSEC